MLSFLFSDKHTFTKDNRKTFCFCSLCTTLCTFLHAGSVIPFISYSMCSAAVPRNVSFSEFCKEVEWFIPAGLSPFPQYGYFTCFAKYWSQLPASVPVSGAVQRTFIHEFPQGSVLSVHTDLKHIFKIITLVQQIRHMFACVWPRLDPQYPYIWSHTPQHC